ncbi:MAG TPA: hypothetical protein VE954_36855 [Oligoflexus sp.]|uniref:hypothetical protein n=1 Tax=Oligoflexus sp. TaxID=1971216 RepID=UPI002D3DA7BD|nr:hypothetical protein [Oligoflexus sp.]HYX38708.1 hypothetical protein [Oligoflexus sp.]
MLKSFLAFGLISFSSFAWAEAEKSQAPAQDPSDLIEQASRYGLWNYDPKLPDTIQDPLAAVKAVCDLLQKGGVYQAYFDYKSRIDSRCQKPTQLLRGLGPSVSQDEFASIVLIKRLFQGVEDGHLRALTNNHEYFLNTKPKMNEDLGTFFDKNLGLDRWREVKVSTLKDFDKVMEETMEPGKLMVLDFRNNGGGTSEEEQTFIRTMEGYLGKRLSSCKIPRFQSIQNLNWLVANAEGDKAAFEAELNDLLERNISLPGPTVRTDLWGSLYETEDGEEEMEALQILEEKRIRGRIYGVIDASCASSCELAILYLKALHGKQFVTIGQPTHGALRYGDPVYYLIPGTRVILYLANSILDVKDFPELRGIKPDIVLHSTTK